MEKESMSHKVSYYDLAHDLLITREIDKLEVYNTLFEKGLDKEIVFHLVDLIEKRSKEKKKFKIPAAVYLGVAGFFLLIGFLLSSFWPVALAGILLSLLSTRYSG